jgi:hypothetical protein
MEQSLFLEAGSSSASQETHPPPIPPTSTTFYGTLKVCYHIHKSPPRVPLLSQINPVHTFLPNFFQTHFNMIPLGPRLPSCLFFSGFPSKSLYTPLLVPIHTTCSAHPIFSPRSHFAILRKMPVWNMFNFVCKYTKPSPPFSGNEIGKKICLYR